MASQDNDEGLDAPRPQRRTLGDSAQDAQRPARAAQLNLPDEALRFQVEGALMNEYRIDVAMAVHGRPQVAEDNAERFLTAFEDVHPKAGPAVGANLVTGTLEVTFSVDAPDVNAALDIGREHFADAVSASELPATDVVRIEIEAVPADELEDELQPAHG